MHAAISGPWDAEQVAEIRRREALGHGMGGSDRVARQRAAGRAGTVRERIAALLDPDTWRETGALGGGATYDESGALAEFVHSTIIVGQGAIDGGSPW